MRMLTKWAMIMVIVVLTSSAFGMSDENDKNKGAKKPVAGKVLDTKSLTQKERLELHQKYLKSLRKFSKKQNKAIKKIRKSHNPGSGKNSNIKGVNGCKRDSAGNPVKRTKSYR